MLNELPYSAEENIMRINGMIKKAERVIDQMRDAALALGYILKRFRWVYAAGQSGDDRSPGVKCGRWIKRDGYTECSECGCGGDNDAKP